MLPTRMIMLLVVWTVLLLPAVADEKLPPAIECPRSSSHRTSPRTVSACSGAWGLRQTPTLAICMVAIG